STVTSAGTFTVSVPATVNAKDLTLVHESAQTSAGATTTFPTAPTDNSGGNTWAQVSGSAVVSGALLEQYVWWKWAVSGDASSTVTVTRPGGTLVDTTAVVDVYKGLDSTKAGPQTTATTNSGSARKITTPAITPTGATTQEHMIMVAAINFNTSTNWATGSPIAATGGNWTVTAGTQTGALNTSQGMSTWDSDTSANTAYAATTATGNAFGA